MIGVVYGVLANVVAGCTWALLEIAVRGWPPATAIVVRLAISAILFRALLRRGWLSRATQADRRRLVLMGSLGLGAPYLLSALGLIESNALSGAILIGLEPLAMVVLARVVLREPLTRAKIAALVVGFLGAAFAVSRGDWHEAVHMSGATLGAVLLALQAMLYPVYSIGAKPTLERVSPAGVAYATSLVALVLILPASMREWRDLDWSRALAPGPLSALLVLSVVVTWAGGWLWNAAIDRITASQFAVLIFVQPISGMALGIALGAKLDVPLAVGAMLVMVAMWLSRSQDDQDKTS